MVMLGTCSIDGYTTAGDLGHTVVLAPPVEVGSQRTRKLERRIAEIKPNQRAVEFVDERLAFGVTPINLKQWPAAENIEERQTDESAGYPYYEAVEGLGLFGVHAGAGKRCGYTSGIGIGTKAEVPDCGIKQDAAGHSESDGRQEKEEIIEAAGLAAAIEPT